MTKNNLELKISHFGDSFGNRFSAEITIRTYQILFLEGFGEVFKLLVPDTHMAIIIVACLF